jgi:hypothetical protein
MRRALSDRGYGLRSARDPAGPRMLTWLQIRWNPVRSALRPELPPESAVTIANVQPACAATVSRASINVRCTPRRRKAGRVAAPPSTAVAPKTMTLAAPTGFPSIMATSAVTPGRERTI